MADSRVGRLRADLRVLRTAHRLQAVPGRRAPRVDARPCQRAPTAHHRALRPGLSASFDDVIRRGMAKQPADRYSSTAELVRAARSALTNPRAENRSAPHPRRERDEQAGRGSRANSPSPRDHTPYARRGTPRAARLRRRTPPSGVGRPHPATTSSTTRLAPRTQSTSAPRPATLRRLLSTRATRPARSSRAATSRASPPGSAHARSTIGRGRAAGRSRRTAAVFATVLAVALVGVLVLLSRGLRQRQVRRAPSTRRSCRSRRHRPCRPRPESPRWKRRSRSDRPRRASRSRRWSHGLRG